MLAEEVTLVEEYNTRDGFERRAAEGLGSDNDSGDGGAFMSRIETFAPCERRVRVVERPRPEDLLEGVFFQLCRF